MEILLFIENITKALPIVGIILFFVVVLWAFFDWQTPFNDRDEIFHKNNIAYLLQRTSLGVAQIIALLAVIPDYNIQHPLESTFWLFTEGLWVTIALLIARWVIEKAFFHPVNSRALLKDGNIAVGIMEAGAYLGIGILLGGSLSGVATSIHLSIVSTVVFYVLGLLTVIAVFWLYELLTPYKMRALIMKGHQAAGIEQAGVFVATCIAIQTGVAGDFVNWSESIAWFFITAFVALLILVVVFSITLLLAKYLWKLPKDTLTSNPSLSVASFRAISMIMASIVASAILSTI
jgi:uncharacterized membrane protein YjfL (UPF0719 family)